MSHFQILLTLTWISDVGFGPVMRYKRLWYAALPMLGMLFGYMAYLLFSSGLIAFNAGSQSNVSSTMLVCFLAGFAANWIICRLSGLSR